MAQRVSPGQVWSEHLDRTTTGQQFIVNEVYENLDGGRRPDYATMLHRGTRRHAFTITLDDLRAQYVLTKDVPADTPRNPAEKTAKDDGLPVVLLTPGEALMVAQGRSIIFPTADGGRALVRLFRPEEFIAYQHAAVTSAHDDGFGPPDLKISTAQAERLVAPLRIP